MADTPVADPAQPEEETTPTPAATPISLKTPAGQIVDVDPADAQSAVSQYGYTTPTAQELHAYDAKAKYDNLPGEAKAAIAGAARTMSLGTSDLIAVKQGLVKPETFQDLSDVNPLSTLGGEAFGAVVSPVGEVGSAVEGAAKAGMAARGLGSEVLQAVGSKAAGSAVEGALFNGVGNSITEAALGDPDLNGEKIASNFLYGGLFGAGVGAALGGASEALPAALGKAKDAFTNLYSKTVGLAGEEPGILAQGLAKAQAPLSGTSSEDFLSALRTRAEDVKGGTASEQDTFIRGLSKNLNDINDQVSATSKAVSSKIRPEENSKLLSGVPVEAAQPAIDRVTQALDDSITKMRESPDIYPARYAAKLDEVKQGLVKRLGNAEDAGDAFNLINEAKGVLDKKTTFGTDLTGASADANYELQGLRGVLKSSLEDQSVFGQAATRQAAYNDAVSSHINNQKLFAKRFLDATTKDVSTIKVQRYIRNMGTLAGDTDSEVLSNFLTSGKAVVDEAEKTYQTLPEKGFSRDKLDNLFTKQDEYQSGAPAIQSGINSAKKASQEAMFGGVGKGIGGVFGASAILHNPLAAVPLAIYKALKTPDRLITGLARIEGIVSKTSSGVEKAAKSVFDTTDGLTGKAAGLYLVSHDSAMHKKLADNLTKVANNPQTLLDHVTDHTASAYDVAPNTTSGIQQTAMRAATFLSSKLPQKGNPVSSPFNKPYEPSATEIAQFDRYRTIVENPTLALKQVKDGTLTKETIETLNAVYPKLYQEMQQEVMKQASSLKKDAVVPYKTQQSVSIFLGTPVNSSMEPQAVQGYQAAIAAAAGAKAHPAPPPHGTAGLAKLDLSARSATSFQATSQRHK